MSIGTVTVNGMQIPIEVVGMSEVRNINGSYEVHVSLAPVLPSGPNGGGEPMPVAA